MFTIDIRRYRLAVGVFLWTLALPVSAQEAVLSSAKTQFSAGQQLTIFVTFLNTSRGVMSNPAQLGARLRQSGKTESVILAATATVATQAGGFSRVAYTVDTPKSLSSGPTEIELSDMVAEPLLVMVIKAEPEAAEPAQLASLQDETHLGRDVVLLEGLSTYKPIYFLGGIDPLDAKFQISLKYQLFNKSARWASEHNWLEGFHLAYTQLSFWDLESESRPFEDTNFKPEVFYAVEGLKLGFLPEDSHLDLQTGFLHESNGRDGEDSRSLNIIYHRASLHHELGRDWFAKFTGDLWSYVGSLKDNPDIADFRGHSSFQLTAGHKRGLQLAVYRRGRVGKGKSSYLFDLTFPLTRPGIKKPMNFSVHSQLFTGYGENLLTYRKKETRFRIGLGIHR